MLSMTGYGKGVASTGNLELSVEMKGVNNRYLDINAKMPRQFLVFENKIREWIKATVLRGKISLFIDMNVVGDDASRAVLNRDKISAKFGALRTVSEWLNLPGDVSMEHLVAFPELFETDYSDVQEEVLEKLLKEAVSGALKEFNAMRSTEGSFLKTDMNTRIDIIEELMEQAFEKSRSTVSSEFERLKAQVMDLIGEQKLDINRLEQEIALIADKVDITEECIRLRSHIKLYRETLDKGREIGKKLTFILQEMLREANTINSKSAEVETLHNVIRIKEEIEKLREQAQNIE